MCDLGVGYLRLGQGSADHVIELGPEGGEAGGHLVAQGTPREVAKKPTATGLVLKELFAKGARTKPSKVGPAVDVARRARARR